MCEYCKWNSDALQLAEPQPQDLFRKLSAWERERAGRDEMARLIKSYKQKEAHARKLRQERMFSLPLAGAARGSISLTALSRGVTDSSLALDTSLQTMTLEQVDRLVDQRSTHRLPPPPPAADAPAAASAGAVPLDADAVSAAWLGPVDMTKMTPLSHRLAHPAAQAEVMDQLYPKRKLLWTKMAHRCRKCKKYLVKPEAHPRSYKFEKRALALHVLPSVTLSRPNAWQIAQSQRLMYVYPGVWGVVECHFSHILWRQ
jgi:hypothetical protein